MLKLLILACVAVWLAGLFLGRRRRVIRSAAHLTQLIIWLMLVFMAAAYLPRAGYFQDHLAARGVVLAIWFFASYKLSQWIAGKLDKSRK
ncbi:hypothetical protein [Desulfocurvus sp. DL9XJH121]